MRAARLHGPGDLRIHDEPDPVPGPGEELISVSAVGLCGSDRHWYMDGALGGVVPRRPLVLGHEVAGVVASGPRRGLRVVFEPADPCDRCELLPHRPVEPVPGQPLPRLRPRPTAACAPTWPGPPAC